MKVEINNNKIMGMILNRMKLNQTTYRLMNRKLIKILNKPVYLISLRNLSNIIIMIEMKY